MSDQLQEAADKLENRIPIDADERKLLAEAARKVANPPQNPEPPEDMSINEKQAWKEGWFQGWLRGGIDSEDTE